MKLFSLSLFLFLSCASVSAAAPNIVFILADDMGYGDVQTLNPKSKIPTPNIDRLAREGMTFTDAHSSSAVCTPTRYSVVTGRYCWRSKLKSGVLNGYGEPLIEADRPTVASFLKKNAYHTGVIGKWHLGLGFQKNDDGSWNWKKPLTYSPKTLGFEYSYVIPASLDFPPYIYIENGVITEEPSETQTNSPFPKYWRKGERAPGFIFEDCLDHLTEKARAYIKEQADKAKPFMLYFPLTSPHKPALPHKRFQGKSGLGPYGDFVMQTDWTVGSVLDAIDEAGIADNTLVIYTSDNGSYMYRYDDDSKPDHVKDESVQGFFSGNHTANGVLRGTKADVWEAGHRVPFFARWPKQIKAGSTCDRTICSVDFFSTAAEAAGLNLPPSREAAQDSFSLIPLFKGKKNWKRAPVIHHSSGGTFAIRNGEWKLIMGSGSGGREQPRGKKFAHPWHLYNMKEDLSEQDNRLTSERTVVQDLETQALSIIANGRSR